MDRQQAHHSLDRLGPAQFAAVAQLLEVLATASEPLQQSLSRAPEEDEEITPESGEGVSHEEILREFRLIR